MRTAADNALDGIIHGWITCLKQGPPYVFPGDPVECLARVNYNSHEEFIQSPVFGCSSDTRIHLGLIPQPYIGNLKTARLVLLSLNPGLNHGEYLYDKNENFKKALCRNIKQELGVHDFPFIFLNPEFAWHSGFSYWTKHLNGLIETIIDEGRAKNFNEALKFLAQRIACIELFAYHSRKSPALDHLNLASSQRAIDYVHQVLSSRATNNQCVVLAIRRKDIWSRSGRGMKLHKVKSAQAGTVSLRNCGKPLWKKIMHVMFE